MLEVKNFTLKFNEDVIIDNVSFKCEEGKIIGIVGPSGMGKSSLIKSLVGVYKGTNGAILIDGDNVYDNGEVKQKLAYVPDEHMSYNLTTLKEIVKNHKRFYKGFNEAKFYKINELFNIPLNKRYFQLSKGMKVRVNFMMALALDSKYIFLDEPTSGLDPILKEKVLKLIVHEVTTRNATVIITSHQLHELERICDDVIFLDKGKIAYENSILFMKKNTKKIQVAFDIPVYKEDLINIPGIFKITQLGRVFTIVTERYDEEFIATINKFKPLFIEDIDLSLEEVFINKLEKEEESYEKIFK